MNQKQNMFLKAVDTAILASEQEQKHNLNKAGAMKNEKGLSEFEKQNAVDIVKAMKALQIQGVNTNGLDSEDLLEAKAMLTTMKKRNNNN